MLAAAALIERLRALEYPHSAHVGHGDVGGRCREAVPAGYHSPVCALRLAALRGAFSRSLATWSCALHRIGSVAQSDSGGCGAPYADGADQRTDVASLVPALAQVSGNDRRAVGPVRYLSRPVRSRRGAIYRTRKPQRRHDRQSQARRAGTAGRRRQAGTADVRHPRPSGGGGGVDPSGRGRDPAQRASNAGGSLPVAADGDRSTPSQTGAKRSPA